MGRHSVLSVAIFQSIIICAALPSRADGPSASDRATPTLSERISALEARVAGQGTQIEDLCNRVEAARTRSANAAQSVEVHELVREVLADSGFRESLYPGLHQIGYENGFYVHSADEGFLLRVTGWVRMNWIGQNRQTDDGRQQGRQKQDDLNGFDMEDVRLCLTGYIHTPRLTYHIEGGGDTDSGNGWECKYAYITYRFSEAFQVTAGMLKVPFGRQELANKTSLLFADRSIPNEVFNFERMVGVVLHGSVAERLRYAMSISNGLDNRDDSPSREQLDTNFAYAGRLVLSLLGEKIVAEDDLAYSKSPKLETGLSLAYNDDNGDRGSSGFYSIPDRIRRGRGVGGIGMSDLTRTDLFQFGADVAFQYRGLSVTAEYWLRAIDGDSKFSDWEQLTGRSDTVHQQGGYIQAGYFILPQRVEVAARLGAVWDNDGDDVYEYAVGLNYFPWQSYNMMLRTDFTRVSEVPASSSTANWSQNDEISMIRVQLQAKF